MPPDYLWSDTDQINRYIQGRKAIMVGDTAGERGQGDINFSESAAKEYENEAVNDIGIELSVMFNRPPSKASAVATIDASKVVTDITVRDSGDGYTEAPTVTIGEPPSGGSAAQATASISDGQVSISLTDGGSGYTETPTITISGGVIPNLMLSRFAAKLTAAKIGAVYVGTSEGYVPNWILWYNNEVFASLFRLMLSVDYFVKSCRPTAPLDTTLIPTTLHGLTFRPEYSGIGLADMLVLAKPRFTFIDRGSIQ